MDLQTIVVNILRRFPSATDRALMAA